MACGLPGEPGADRTGAVTDQAGHVVGTPALGGIRHKRALQAELLTQKMVMNSSHSEQGRHRHRGGIELGRCTGCIHSIGKHQHLGTVTDCLLRRLAERIQRRFQATCTGFHRHLGREGRDRQALLTDRGQFGFIEHRGLEMNHRSRLGLGLEGRAPLPEMHLRLMTSFSRRGSIGGLVTWAKRCLK